MKSSLLRCFALFFPVVFSQSTFAEEALEKYLPRDETIVFIGDSITFSGGYVSRIDLQLRSRAASCEVFNVGLSSETVTGHSEPGHPFPRPNVMERIGRVLKAADPDVVVVCYGMNDGIYHPPSETRLLAYQAAITELVGKIKAYGAEVVLMTPPPFETEVARKRGSLATSESKSYGYRAIYPAYNDVIREYADWILENGSDIGASIVVDTFHELETFMSSAEGQNVNLTGDGVHPLPIGHQVLAATLLKAWGETPINMPAELLTLSEDKMKVLRNSLLSKTGHKRPGIVDGLPWEDAWAKSRELNVRIDAALIPQAPRVNGIQRN